MSILSKRAILRGSVATGLFGALLATARAAGAAPAPLVTPDQDRPGDWWQWMNGNISGATAAAIEVISPPAAQTADSIAIVWNKPAGVVVESYDVYLGNVLVASTPHTDYTFQGLAPAKTYDMSVRARLTGAAPLQSNTLRMATKPRPKLFDITKFGAVGDGKTLNTRAIQKAIDACTPGGVVRIPAGSFLSGAIFLKSDMTLHLDKDALLLGSTNPKDYPVMIYRAEGREKPCYASLVGTPEPKGTRWRNIAITGSGTINGNGSALRKNEVAEKAGERGCLISIRDTDGVYLQGVTFRQSPFWCVHPTYCDGLTVNGVSIHTKYDEAGKQYAGMVNGDGMDPDSCRNMFVFNSYIASQDDCIAIKSGRDAEGRAVGKPSENIRISNCHFASGFGVAMGSEMAGGVRNVLVEDCVFENTFSIASVKAPRPRGGVIENITYRDCKHSNTNPDHHDGQWFRGALYVDQYYGVVKPDLQTAQPRDESTATIRNILFQNISLDTVGGNAIWLAGLPESPLQNIRLENVTATGEHGFIAYNIRGLTLDNVSVKARDGNGMQFVNVK